MAGILTIESEWTPPFGDSFSAALSGLSPLARLDLGIALKKGSFNNIYAESGELTAQTSSPEVSLISFFINLTKQLQLLGNALGIDLDAYYNCYDYSVS